MAERDPLDKEEFLALIDQKADDWRELTRISASFLGVAGAFFTAGVARQSAWVIVMAPIPLFLGVLHMTHSARLQLQMITYLSVFSPFTETSWERDIAKVRRRFWGTAERGWFTSRIEALASDQSESLARHLINPSAWDVWLLLAVLVALGVDAVPWLMGFDDGFLAFLAGLVVAVLLTAYIMRNIARIEPERDRWEALWRRYKRDELDPQ
jgi:hypothetical protein